jgi:hypothetical protein
METNPQTRALKKIEMQSENMLPKTPTLATVVDLLTPEVIRASLAFESGTDDKLWIWHHNENENDMWLPLQPVDEVWFRYEIEKSKGIQIDRDTMHDAVQLVCSRQDLIKPHEEVPRCMQK